MTYNNKYNVRARAVLLAGILAAALIAACSSGGDDDTITYSDAPVSFATSDASPFTRTTTGPINGEQGIKDLSEGFGVFGYLTDQNRWTTAKGAYTGTDEAYPKPVFMLNQDVVWNSYLQDWTYSPLKYWPNSTENILSRFISFFAYAPYTAADEAGSTGLTDGITTMTGTADRSPYIYYVMGNPGAMVDLLWANCVDATRNGYGLIEVDDGNNVVSYQKVPLTFQHALACVDIYVQRIYDEPSYGGKKPVDEKQTKIFVNSLTLNLVDADATAVIKGKGRLNLENGSWESLAGKSGVTNTDRTISFGESSIETSLRGTTEQGATAASLALVREHELSKWDASETGVDDVERPLVSLVNSLMIIPQTLTLTPTVGYSLVTRDNDLATSTITDVSGNRYARLLQEQEGNASTITFDAGKRYRMVIHIGAEHVSFEVASVVDWDFPLRFNPNVPTFNDETISHTLNEN